MERGIMGSIHSIQHGPSSIGLLLSSAEKYSSSLLTHSVKPRKMRVPRRCRLWLCTMQSANRASKPKVYPRLQQARQSRATTYHKAGPPGGYVPSACTVLPQYPIMNRVTVFGACFC